MRPLTNFSRLVCKVLGLPKLGTPTPLHPYHQVHYLEYRLVLQSVHSRLLSSVRWEDYLLLLGHDQRLQIYCAEDSAI